jgi:type VI secretion system protein VasG
MGLDSGSLIKTLNKTCLDALQAAAGLCLSRTNPSVEVEHWLLKLAEAPGTDLTRLFRHFEVDPSRLQAELTRAIDRFRTGNARTPVLSTRNARVRRRPDHRRSDLGLDRDPGR